MYLLVCVWGGCTYAYLPTLLASSFLSCFSSGNVSKREPTSRESCGLPRSSRPKHNPCPEESNRSAAAAGFRSPFSPTAGSQTGVPPRVRAPRSLRLQALAGRQAVCVGCAGVCGGVFERWGSEGVLLFEAMRVEVRKQACTSLILITVSPLTAPITHRHGESCCNIWSPTQVLGVPHDRLPWTHCALDSGKLGKAALRA